MSSNRYSALNRRPAATSSLFSDYPGNTSTSRPSSSSSHTRPHAYPSASPRPASPYNNGKTNQQPSPYSYNPATNGKLTPPPESNQHDPFGPANPNSTFHPASPNKKGQYSTSVLEELEAQNDNAQTSILSQKVSQLKTLTIAIGDEIRDSSQLASQINDSFESTSVRLKGTWKRMMVMAKKTGVGWKVWLLFFVAVWMLFAWVWLF